MAKIFLILTGALFLGFGAYYMVTPEVLAEMAGVTATSATGVVELQAMYGGLQIAVGVIALLAAFSAVWQRAGLLAVLIVYAGLGLVRLASAAVASEFSNYVVTAVAFELICAAIAWLLWRREARSPALAQFEQH